MNTKQIFTGLIILGVLFAIWWFFIKKSPQAQYGICKGTCPGTNLAYHYYGPKPCNPACPDAESLALIQRTGTVAVSK